MRLKATAPIVFAGLAFVATTARAETPLEIVVLGDSLVAGYELAPGEDYPTKLEAALRENLAQRVVRLHRLAIGAGVPTEPL